MPSAVRAVKPRNVHSHHMLGSMGSGSSTSCLLSCTGSGRKVDSSMIGDFGYSSSTRCAKGASANGGVCHAGFGHVCSGGDRGVVLAYMSKNFIDNFRAVFKTHGFFENNILPFLFVLINKRQAQ